MKYLSRLTLAETLIILTGDKTPLSELLKFTFMDLLLKQVLAIREVQRQASSRDPIRVYKYVVIGENFNSYQMRLHERAVLSIFQTNSEANVLFRNLVKIAYQNAKSERHFYPQLTSNPNLKEAISTSVLQKVLAKFSYTKKGIDIKGEVQNEITGIEKNVSEYLKTDRNRGIELLRTIGGNIFLLKALEFEISKEFEKVLFEEMTKRNTGTGCSTGCWPDFKHYSDSFESSCSSDSGTGCGGNSGCSGCSGCGGCGGD